jgi:hypothetical protein
MLPVDLIIDLFDKTVLPILTYSCEIWGHDVTDIVVNLQLKLYKYVYSKQNFYYTRKGKCFKDKH